MKHFVPQFSKRSGDSGHDLDRQLASRVAVLARDISDFSKRLDQVINLAAPVRLESGIELATSSDHLCLATTAISDRSIRTNHFNSHLFADPAWDMLLNLYRSELLQVRTTVSSLCLASKVPATTALRWIATLDGFGLLLKCPDRFDGRRCYIELSESGSKQMKEYFDELEASGISVDLKKTPMTPSRTNHIQSSTGFKKVKYA